MLVLTRKENESIKINDNIKITVVRIDRGTVRIGVEAPEYVCIVREKVVQQKKKGGG